jgi:hypothetical protein
MARLGDADGTQKLSSLSSVTATAVEAILMLSTRSPVLTEPWPPR